MKRKMLMARITAALLSGAIVSNFLVKDIVTYAFENVNQEDGGQNSENLGNDYKSIGGVVDYTQAENKVIMQLETGEKLMVSFLENGVFRVYMDPTGKFQENPTPDKEEQITKIIEKTEENYKEDYNIVVPTVEDGDIIKIYTSKIELRVEKATGKMELINKDTNKSLWKEAEPLKYKENETIQTLETNADEYFYGGGMQNGRFSHKGKTINIKNENNWVDGGVASPNPFYWSTSGYGVMRHTFKPGKYAFGSNDNTRVTTTHNEKRFDAYYFVDEKPTNIINEFTELTGKPILMPEYGFYLGNLDCYSRDWINDETGKESQTPKPGFDRQETLMVDAKRVLDEHIENDMPLGYFMPNDGYGCGYGREETIDGNIENLKQFADYARDNGIQTGLWTQSTLKPTGNQPAYLERDIDKEVGVAGTNAVKTDVAWVGPGYSFALDSVRQAAQGIENNSKDNARPFVVSLDGWAGTQRYASIWSGDQYGGEWEYIRFHIPTYIGSGLSGQPNVGSDMDGIFGGDDLIQTRDFQWKTFTPIQLDMDGWGSLSKNPYQAGEPYTSINRMYLKLKSAMMPYNYSIANEATDEGMPMVRAMMLEYPNAHTYGTATEYQYMWGPNMLVAPIYQNTAADANGNDIRNDIYLPDEDQIWIDYFTGEQYRGGGVLNNFEAPVWKLPTFVKNGAIIPMINDNNTPEDIDDSKRIYEIYPSGETNFDVYEDDGLTTDYKDGKSANTSVTSKAPKTGKGTAEINVGLLTGSYNGMVTERETEFIVNVSEKPSNLTAKVGGNDIKLTEATSLEDFQTGTNKYYYDEAPNLNKHATEGSDFGNVEITTTPKVYVKVESTNVTKNEVKLTVNDFINVQPTNKNEINENLATPINFKATEDDITPNEIPLTWNKVKDAETYDVEIDGIVYNNISTNAFIHKNLEYDTTYNYRVRAVNVDGYSKWSEKISPKTLLDPYRNVPRDMETIWEHGQYSSDAPENAVDNDDNSQFHSAGNAIDKPFVIDMKKSYSIEKLDLLFRKSGNGSVKRAEIYSSLDGVTYEKIFSNAKDTGKAAWATDGEVKAINFDQPINARYFKIVVKESVGNFLAMREFRPYKVEGTDGKVVGDWNNSGTIEEGDLVFLENYAGLTTVDSDWGYVSSADLNQNGVIDAYDIAYVATQLEGGVEPSEMPLSGEFMLLPSKTDLKAGEEFTVDVVGTGLSGVNSLSVEIPVDTAKYEVVSQPVGTILTHGMKNLSKNRVHTDGTQDIYAIFTNVGENFKVTGTDSVARFTLKAKVDTKWDVNMTDALIVDSNLNSKAAIGENTDVDTELPEGKPTISKVNKENITVTGDATQLQPGMGLDRLIDGTTSSDDNSRMDFIWIGDPEPAVKGTLPFEMTFEFDKVRELDNFTIYNRINGDGKLNTASMKKVKAVGYLNGVATDLGEKEVTAATTVYDLGGASYDKIVITALESFKDQHTLAINEIEFYEKSGQEATGIEFAENTVDSIYLNKFKPIFAKVTPDNVTNGYYRITSDNPEVIEVIRIDSGKDVNYYLKGVSLGTAKITATTADGKFTVEKTITVGEGIDKTLLIESINDAKKYEDLSEIYTPETYNALAEAIKAAEVVVGNDDATEADITQAIESLRSTTASLKERDTVEEDKIDFNKLEAIDATSEADKDLKENAVDGDEESIWHSGYQDADNLPVSITIKVDKSHNLNQIDYLPRQTSSNGHISKYRVETSLDGETWTVAREGKLETKKDNSSLVNTGYNPIRFNSVEAEYVRFTALESLGEAPNKYASVAELAFYGQEVKVEANKSELEKVIAEASIIEEKDYTAESFAKLQAAIEEAKVIVSNADATQEQVDGAVASLKKAIEDLVKVENPEVADKTELQNAITEAEKVKAEEYTAESFAKLQAAIEEAKAIVAKVDATQTEVNLAVLNIKAAVEALVKVEVVDKGELQNIITEAEKLKAEAYTAESFAKLQAVIKEAKAVLAKVDATQAEVNGAVSMLKVAIAELVEAEKPVVNKDELQKVIVKASGLEAKNYTEESFALVLEKLKNAKEVLDNVEATQVEVDSAMNGLNNAIDALVKAEDVMPGEVSKDKLQSLVNQALALQGGDYTTDSFAKLQEALKVAQALLLNEEATQSEIDKAFELLDGTIKGLVSKDKVEGKPDTKPGKGDKLPETGGVSAGSVGLLGVITSALGIAIFKKKKK